MILSSGMDFRKKDARCACTLSLLWCTPTQSCAYRTLPTVVFIKDRTTEQTYPSIHTLIVQVFNQYTETFPNVLMNVIKVRHTVRLYVRQAYAHGHAIKVHSHLRNSTPPAQNQKDARDQWQTSMDGISCC